jgi:hypothetical protein
MRVENRPDRMLAQAQRGLWWLSLVAVVAMAEWTVVQFLASPL